jgi:adenylate cyclase
VTEDEARAQTAEVLRQKPDFRVEAEMLHCKCAADEEHVHQGLLKAGLPE